jgi:uncharacterized repeat protein (TIGR01451 family)
MLALLAWLFLSALFFASVPALAQTSVTNVATITPPASVVNSNPSPSCTLAGVCPAQDTDTVITSADLGLTKSASVTAGTAGSTFTYVIAFGNSGPSTAQSLTLTDSLSAAGLTLVGAVASSGTLSTSTSNVTLTLASLASGAGGTLTLTVVATSGTGSITNVASITSTTFDPNTVNNTSTSTISRVSSADLRITKTASVSAGTVGQTFSYVITFGNAGPSAAANVTLTDALVGLTLVSATNSVGTLQTSTSNVTLTLASLASGAGGTLTLTVQVSTGSGSITNAAALTSTTPDPTPGNNTSTTVTSRIDSADLRITKTASVSAGTVGQTFSYVITFDNAGPSTAANVTLTDALVGLTLVSATNSVGTLQTSSAALTVTLGSLASGAGGTLTLTVQVSTGSGSITNAAALTSTTPDPTPGNNTSTTVTSRIDSADLRITKTASVSAGTVGQTFSYVITFGNAGPSTAANVTLTDALVGLTLVSATNSVGTLQTSTSNVTLTLASLASGAGGTLTLTVQVSTGSGSITNAAALTSTTPDPTPGNNTSTTVTSRIDSADLRITKTASVSAGTVGQTFSYVITFDNAGPSTAANVTLTDALVGLTLVSATNSVGTLQTSSAALTVTLGSLASGAGGTLTLTVQVSTGSGSITNAAALTSTTPDPTPGNNTSTTVTSRIDSADLRITKTASVSAGTVGQTFSYVITFGNAGPSTAANVTLTDALVGLTLVSATNSVGTLQTSSAALTVTLGSLASGAGGTLTLTVQVSTGSGSITNAAALTSTTPDPTPGNNTSTTVTSRIDSADLRITKTASVSAGTVGQTFSYVITFGNAGPSTAANVTLTDALVGLTLVSATNSVGTLQTSTSNVTLTLASLASGAGGTLTLTVQVSTGSGSITNAAALTSTTPDPTPGNNTSTTVTSRIDSADLRITKTASVSAGTVGQTFSYVITFGNAGPSTAANVTLTDALVGLTLVSATNSVGTLQTSSAALTVTLGSLASGAGGTLTLTVQVSTGSGSITNAAALTSTTPDPTPGNNTSTTVTSRIDSADLRITKTASVSAGTVGQTFSYVITFDNAGPSTAANVTLTDALVGLTLVSATNSVGTLQTSSAALTVTLGSLASGAGGTLTLTVQVSTGSGSITNAAALTSTTPTRPPATTPAPR